MAMCPDCKAYRRQIRKLESEVAGLTRARDTLSDMANIWARKYRYLEDEVRSTRDAWQRISEEIG